MDVSVFWSMRVCRAVASHAGAAALLCLPATALPAQTADADLNAPMQVARFTGNDTLRGFVGTHLQDPDLWPTVLKINDIASPADLVPGMALRLPVRQVLAADRALRASLHAIQAANAEGARIFAPTEIGAAIDNRETAVLSREDGAWRDAVTFSGIATAFADEALVISLEQRDRAAEAIVSDVQGRVEGRAPAEPRWSGRELNDVLVEFERLRTLSASTTQITFRDLSRLRLNPNSNATIQRMRSDPLTGGEVTKVSLVAGDFYALLNQLSEKSEFEIDVPGIRTSTNSADFWVKNDRTGARFVNYDAPELEIVAGDRTIEVGENEGVLLTGRSAERTTVLTAPRLAGPESGAVVHAALVPLTWDSYEGAEGYWLEIARDSGFNQMQVSEWGLRQTGFAAELPEDSYHWRVAALDRLGLPGEWSAPGDFSVRLDSTPPFLALLSPEDGVIATSPRAEILGASEPDAKIRLDGKPVPIDPDGTFVADLALAPGENIFTVTAEDPARNLSTRTTRVFYRPGAVIDIAFLDDMPREGEVLVTRSDGLSVRAATTADPGAGVVIRDVPGGAVVLQTGIGPAGDLVFTVPVDAVERRYRVEVLAPGGKVEGSLDFVARRDRNPPELVLTNPPPRVTGETAIALAGNAGDAVRLALNGKPVELVGGRFAVTETLVVGANTFEIVASDAAGNAAALNLRTVLDNAPPEILRVDLGRPTGRDGPIELRVEARDDSGLVQAAPYLISVGGVEREGFLRCDGRAGVCRAALPPEAGRLELIELMVEDYAGNAAFE